jgi:glycosyltransferase involved in cell wall biosynthesis
LNIAIINPVFRTHNLNFSLVVKGMPKVPTEEIPEINIVELANELAILGNNVTVYAADSFVHFKEISLSDRLKIRSIPAKLQKIFLPALIPFTPSLSSSLMLREADVIQSAEFYQFSTFSAASLAAREKIPFFVWQEAFHYMRPPAKPFQRFFDFTAGRSISATTYKFILRTKKAKAFLDEIGIPHSSIGPWIPTGIDGHSYQPRPKTLFPEDFCFPEDSAIILFVGRLTHSKGPDIAIRSISILRKKGVKACLLVRGSGPELNNLITLSKKLKVTEYVRFLGPKSRLEMASLYNSSDVFLLSSRTDLFPFTLLEAAGCGLPSVATRVGSVEDFLQDKINGLLVAPNPEEIAIGIERLLRDKDLRDYLGKNARQFFVENFEMSVVAKHLEALYKNAL